MPAPDRMNTFPFLAKGQADGDAGVQVAGKVQVADGPAVHAPLVVFQLVDDLRRPQLWGSGQGARREDGVDGVHRVAVLPQLPPDGGADVHDVGEALDGQVLLHLYGAEAADLPDVVPAQVHQHVVLGQLLFVGAEALPPAP